MDSIVQNCYSNHWRTKHSCPDVLSWCHEPCLHVAPPSSPSSGVKTKADKTQILRPLRPALTFLSLYTKAIAARNKQTPILGSNWLGCLPTIQPFCQTLLHQLIHCSSQNHKINPKEHHQKITNFPLTAEEKNLTPFTIQSSSLMILKSGFFCSKDPVDCFSLAEPIVRA